MKRIYTEQTSGSNGYRLKFQINFLEKKVCFELKIEKLKKKN